LGSPVSSPSHLPYPSGPHQLQTSHTGFLPGYLMGEHASPSSPSPPSHRPMVSPSKLLLNRSLSVTAPGTPQTPAPAFAGTPRGPAFMAQNTSLNRSHLRTSGEKHGGPPTVSLLGGLNTPNRCNSSAAGTPGFPGTPLPRTPQLGNGATPSYGGTPNTSVAREEIPSMNDQADPMDVWVTVFGFPPSASSYILSQFSACGTVLQHSMPPNANWIHLRFQTRLQAKKAISKNGTVLGSTIMVGVAPCTDSNVLDQLNTSNISHVNDTSLGVTNLNSSLSTPRQIRPLTQAYKDAQEDHKVVPNTNTPNKNSGLVSKAMGCMFGW